MLAPEPFFQARGTPISIFFRLKALSRLGHNVDLVTYHLGEDRFFENLKIARIPNLFSIPKIKIGPSLTKILLDVLLFLKTVWHLSIKRYDLIFSHEEAAFIGTLLGKIWKIPHLYDMHSSLPQQLENFNFSRSRVLKTIFIWLERFVLKYSHAIVVICQDLLEAVKKQGFSEKAVLLENFIDFDTPPHSKPDIEKKRIEYAPEQEKIVLYAGNFQPYQGISLLLEAVAKLKDRKMILLLVGDKKDKIAEMKKKTQELNIANKVFFTGQVPPSQVAFYVSLADALVSPRLSGTNTPLKIYSFLKSGKPLVATDLWTHTQVLNEKISILVKPDAESMASGISKALYDKSASRIALAAKKMADEKYTDEKYLEKIGMALRKACPQTETNA